MQRTMALATMAGIVAVLGVTAPAFAGSHTWKVVEVFSNGDGTVQFIELMESTGSCCEVVLQGKYVRSDATGNQYVFPANLVGNTANRSILLATAAFAALPGAPTPDHIIPANFFSTASDSVEYFVYHAVSFPAPALPLDGIQSISYHVITGVATVGTNSPENYAGVSGSVDASPPPLPPANLAYLQPAPTYFVGVAIAPNTPSWTGGNPESFSIDPDLPVGLALDPVTGWITGNPVAEISATPFTITATNPQGSDTAEITITIDAVPPVPTFQRGDANQDGSIAIADPISLLGYLFQQVPNTCTAALDSNDDGAADLGDAIHLLAYLFSMGSAPPPPFQTCGLDPTAGGAVTCTAHGACP